jgi:hypothetical protein
MVILLAPGALMAQSDANYGWSATHPEGPQFPRL